ncbi:hypothetical protein IXC47_08395 [Herminiimonas contaminans]|uniref:Uncharacterized protein n=2 Tax=Herminiimonas contaminans TaxID=1111140 RepID=A0ABS0ES82_9BURK|nr:hypothetical protein [Herminiimonas contaminans]
MARVLAWSEGYAITMHGSFTRDLYLLAVPWADRVCEPEHPPSEKPHGRLAWTPLYALQSQQSPVQASEQKGGDQ